MLALLLCAFSLSAAELSIPRTTASPGATVTVPVTLRTENASITAMQFDLDYDASRFRLSASAGPAAQGKTLTVSDTAANRKRFLLIGMNHNNIQDGVAVFLTVAVTPDAVPGDAPLTLRTASATNARAVPVPLRVSSGVIVVDRRN